MRAEVSSFLHTALSRLLPRTGIMLGSVETQKERVPITAAPTQRVVTEVFSHSLAFQSGQIFEERRLRLREVKWLIHSHTAGKYRAKF